MNLYLLRHAPAVERGVPSSRVDSKRPLTPEGEKKMRSIAEAMHRLELEFDLILTSPFLRARQTAVIVAEVLQAQDRLRLSAHLAADGRPSRLIEEIQQLTPPPGNLLLVGHEPYLSHLTSRLLAGDNRLEIEFKKGGLCKLEIISLAYDRCARLSWLLTPRQMLAMR